MSQDQIRLLLVDDEANYCRALAAILREPFGFQVDEAADGQAAIDRVVTSGGEYDVILIDQHLQSEPDGIAVLSELRAAYPGIEYVILTGYGPEDRERAVQAGAFRYVEKLYVNHNELALLIRGAARQARLRAMSNDILSQLELKEALGRILDAVASLIEADEAVLTLYDEEAERWEHHHLHLPDDATDARAALENEALADDIRRSSRPVSVPRFAGDYRALAGLGLASIAGAPVAGRSGALGALFAYSRRPDHFDIDKQNNLQALATLAGLALDNARTYQKTSDLAGYMNALSVTSFELAQTTDHDKLLQLAWEFVNKEMRIDTFLVALYDKETDEVTFPLMIDERQLVAPTPFPLRDDKSITAHVIRTGQEFYWPTSDQKREYCDQFGVTARRTGRECHSCLFYPLKIGGRAIGALSVQAYSSHAFPVEFRVACRALGNQLAAALENARLMAEVSEKAGDLVTLQTLSTGIAMSLESGDVGVQTCRAAVEFFGADHSGLVRFEEGYSTGTVTAEFPLGGGALGESIPLTGVPDEQKLIGDRQPLVIERVAERAELGPVSAILLGHGIRSTIIVPVVAGDRLLGSFSVDFFEERRFREIDVDRARAFAAQVAVALDHARLFEESTRRRDLLDALERAARQMRAEKDPTSLMHAIVSGAVELIGCNAGCLFRNDLDRDELELIYFVGLPEEPKERRMGRGNSLVGQVARAARLRFCADYSDSVFVDPPLARFGFGSAVAAPLLSVEGEVRAVLLLLNQEPRVCGAVNRNILERFAVQAAIALRTSEMMTASQRGISQVRLLHQISDAIQAADELEEIFHMVLTGVTADFGLSFNSAGLWLEEGEELVGHIGIGHVNEEEARQDWLQDQQLALNEFGRYYQRLKDGEFREKPTPLDKAVRGLRLPRIGSGILSEVINNRQGILIGEIEKSRLPTAFVNAFQPAFPLVIAPLLSRARVIGLLAADNRFSKGPITDELRDALRGFANTAAVAIDNARLWRETQRRLKKSRELQREAERLAASNAQLVAQRERIWSKATAVAAAVTQEELEPTLMAIAEGTREALGADVVTVYAFDPQMRRFTVCGYSILQQRVANSVRPPGNLTSSSVLYDIIGLHDIPHLLVHDMAQTNPALMGGKFVHSEGIEAAMCLPLRGRGGFVGVMCVDYRAPHTFDDDEIATIQLFADNAAMAIYGQQQYRDATHRARIQEALYTAAKSISGAPTLMETLEQIAIQALAVVEATDAGAACHVALRRGDALQFAAASAPDILRRLRSQVGVLRLDADEKAGIIGRVARTGQSENLGCAPDDPEYLEFEPGTHSELAVPIKKGEDVIGVINLEHPARDYFQPEDQRVVKNLAALAAAAIQTAQHLEQKQIVTEISARVNASLNLSEFLDSLFGQLVEVFHRREVPVYPSLGLYDPESNQLQMSETPFYPGGIRAPYISLDERGVIPWVGLTREPYYAPNVAGDPHYFQLIDDTCSEFAVPVIHQGKLLAVLNLESPVANAFTPDDRDLLRTLAHQIATTIHNVNLYEELRRTQAAVSAQTALIYMNMVTSQWSHRIRNQAQTIVEQVELLERDLQRPPAKQTRVPDRLAMITRLGEEIKRKPIKDPLDREKGVRPEKANALLRNAIEKLTRDWPRIEATGRINVSLVCETGEEDRIAVNPEWFEIVVEHVLQNATQYITGESKPRITIGTRQVGNVMEMYFADNGPGIPAEKKGQLLEAPVAKDRDEAGLGMGLFIARMVMDTYQGKIRAEDNHPRGAIITLSFPRIRTDNES